MMLKSALTAAAAASIVIAPASAQMLSAEQAREDLQALYQGLQEAHYDVYASASPAMLDDQFTRLMETLDGPVSINDLHRDFQRFTALVRNGHARVEGLNPGWSEHLEAGGRVFPLDFRIRNGAVIVTGAPEGSPVEPGDEILAINGEHNAVWLARVTRNISAETPELAYSMFERISPYLMWIEYADTPAYRIEVNGPDGHREVVLNALDWASYTDQPVADAGPDLSGRHAEMLTETIAYLRPGPFYNIDATTTAEAFDPDATRAYVGFIDAAFEDFLEAGADHLILDLRDNPGGDRSYSDPVLAWFADEPFRFYSEFRMRVSEQTTASNAARLEGRREEDYGISGEFAELFSRAPNGDIVLYEIDYTDPHPRRFDGEVYALINRASYSNAVSVGTIIQDYGMGLVVGEATTDMASMFGAMEHFYLPHSGLQIGYPKAHIIRPNGDERLHVLTPDIEIEVPPMSGTRDVRLERLVAIIEG